MPNVPARATSTALSGDQLTAEIHKRGIDDAQWAALTGSLYPGARPEMILTVTDYCKARGLDPFKKPVHIVPMEIRDAVTGVTAWRDVVLPGVNELRITAQRSGDYLGHDPAVWGPEIEYRGVKCFEWCEITVHRAHPKSPTGRISFTVRVWLREVVVLNREGRVNARWTRAPLQMLHKCTEAAALREGFPDSVGGLYAAEELDGARALDVEPVARRALPPKPDRLDDWLIDLEASADEGVERLSVAWRESPADLRDYLAASDPAKWPTLKTRAETADARHLPHPAGPTASVEPASAPNAGRKSGHSSLPLDDEGTS